MTGLLPKESFEEQKLPVWTPLKPTCEIRVRHLRRRRFKTNLFTCMRPFDPHEHQASKSSDPWYTTETRPTNDSSLPAVPYNATALRSRTTSPKGVIDAAKSSIYSDLEQLRMAAYIASVNVFSGTVSFTTGTGGYPNVLEGDDGEPASGAADIVVNSSDVQTFSMVGLISLAAILGFLCIQAWLISWSAHHHSRAAVEFRVEQDKRRGGTEKKSVWERFSDLEAPWLFNDALEAGREVRECKEPTGQPRTVSPVGRGAHNRPGHDEEADIVPPSAPTASAAGAVDEPRPGVPRPTVTA